MVGRLYDVPEYASQRDSGFSLFYMAINIGAMFAPTTAIKIMDWAQASLGVSVEDSYHFAFAVACVSLIVSIAIYYIFGFTYKHVLANESKEQSADAKEKALVELSPAETKERIICLCLVFAVVIFFWMAFHQNLDSLRTRLYLDDIYRYPVDGFRCNQPRGLYLRCIRLVWCCSEQDRQGQGHFVGCHCCRYRLLVLQV